MIRFHTPDQRKIIISKFQTRHISPKWGRCRFVRITPCCDILPEVKAPRHIILLLSATFSLLALADVKSGTVTSFENVSLDQIIRGNLQNRAVEVEGVIAEAFIDPIDRRYAHSFLSDGRDMIDVTFSTSQISSNELQRICHAHVRVKGICWNRPQGWRVLSRPIVSASSLEVLSKDIADIFNAPLLHSPNRFNVGDIFTNNRRSVEGQVQACWNDNHFLLISPDGLRTKVRLAFGIAPPPCGALVRAVGYVDTDAANFILNSAIWKPIDDLKVFTQSPMRLTESDFDGGKFCSTYDGRLVVIRATVSHVADLRYPLPIMITMLGNHPVVIIPGFKNGKVADIAVGAEVELTGILLIQTESWSGLTPFPHISGFSLILRSPEDIRILAQPPWWTTRRLFFAVGALLAALLAILVWNISLQRIASRKGRELMLAQIKQVEAELKISERTRLAAELHDSLAQSITSIAFEVDTANRFANIDSAKSQEHLMVVSSALKSCRDELRNCIWDLRHQALEVDKMDEAIRQTLAPHAKGVNLRIRFDVPRSLFSDTTSHAILCIIRELALNSIRHGKSTAIGVEGAIEDGRLKFSVRDNGCGFDPNHYPGDEQGHYGLLGIRERVNALEGTLHIESASEKGTKTTISINVPDKRSHDR